MAAPHLVRATVPSSARVQPSTVDSLCTLWRSAADENLVVDHAMLAAAQDRVEWVERRAWRPLRRTPSLFLSSLQVLQVLARCECLPASDGEAGCSLRAQARPSPAGAVIAG